MGRTVGRTVGLDPSHVTSPNPGCLFCIMGK
jgi:hypothetical protein